MIAALPREVANLVKGWRREKERTRNVVIHTSEHAVVAYAGMGAARAELAVRAALAVGSVDYLISVGWAGATKSEFSAGSIHHPATVIDAATQMKYSTITGTGILVTTSNVANERQKQNLTASLNADFVDMEAATVARIAAEQGIAFAAVKAISDEHNAVLPDMQRFITADGWVDETAFGLHIALRPWLWPATLRMAQGATLSARNLCAELQQVLQAYEAHVSTPADATNLESIENQGEACR